ncbi:MAG: N-acetyl-gamma-glutamyl-phosphate reductase [Flammeovirgaceae bacterium]|nr:MAG: N-acetyl-gamma-glutamyl-phosphate reductase [Flammeovirgaceae bacterium]
MGNKVKVGIVGGAGYTGGEAIRILLNHPVVEVIFVHSRSHVGQPVHAAHRDMTGETDLKFTGNLSGQADVLFLCLGHGESSKFLQEHELSPGVKVIDLSNDFRLGHSVNGREFVYGLPELNRDKIKTAQNVANPGCFATAIQLGLLPLAVHGLLTEVYTTAITGSTGAGQKLQDSTHFTWRANNISAYKALTHQHVGEINRSLKQLQPSFDGSLHLVPWRGDFTRGIFVSSVVTVNKSLTEIKSLFSTYYAHHPFVVIADEMIDMKQAVNTNKCYVFLELVGDKLVIHSAIDNLVKGASGQAVQNMNLMFGLDESEGLKLKAIGY